LGFIDWLIGPELSAPSAGEAPQVRTDEPGPSDPSKALVIARRESAANSVSENTALGLISVYRAAQILSTAGMQCSLDAFRDSEQIEPKPLLLRKPDPDEPLNAFLEKTYLSLVLNGNAFWRVFRDNQGRVTGLRVLNPNEVTIKVDSDGSVLGYQYGKNDRTYTKAEVKHLSHMRVPGDPRGRGPIQAAQAELRGTLDTRDYASYWFTEAGIPTGVLSSDAPLTADAAKAAKDRWTETQGATRGVAVLGHGLSYSPIYLSPEDAQFIQGQQFNTTAIARLFGIPAGLMLAAVEGSSQTYANLSQVEAGFVKYTLMRYISEVEAALSDLMPRGTEVKANLESLLRPDVISRYSMHKIALGAGWMTKDEVRDIEGLQPLPEGLGKPQKPVDVTPEAAPTEEEEDTNV